MGLLDEAIKDHLELKRRHGADPGEVARLEHEALGPARREPSAPDAPVADEPAHEDADDDLGDEVPADERLEGPVHHAEPGQSEPEPPAAENELREVPEFEPAPARERDEPAPERDEPVASVDQPTRQFSLEELEDASTPPPRAPADPDGESAPPHTDVVPADEEPDGDDVLEETPEFLQETPEHDRLWFEQKPPKDFDS
jgi:hypothetical protein